jgi:hypothetical protein
LVPTYCQPIHGKLSFFYLHTKSMNQMKPKDKTKKKKQPAIFEGGSEFTIMYMHSCHRYYFQVWRFFTYYKYFMKLVSCSHHQNR